VSASINVFMFTFQTDLSSSEIEGKKISMNFSRPLIAIKGF